jgi:hypothetical protein
MTVARRGQSPAAPAEPVRACVRCSTALELLIVLPAAFDHPEYRISCCPACGYVEWLPRRGEAR